MTKREQVIQQMGLLTWEHKAYEQLMDEIRGYCQQDKELSEQEAELQRSGRTDFQVRDEIKQLMGQAALVNDTLPLSINQKQPIHNFKRFKEKREGKL